MAFEVDERLRRLVAERASFRCEYCLLSEDDSFSPHQIDHIISLKYGGASDEDNLALACIRCNAWKGSDIASLDPQSGVLTPCFTRANRFGSITFASMAPSSNRLACAITFMHGSAETSVLFEKPAMRHL